MIKSIEKKSIKSNIVWTRSLIQKLEKLNFFFNCLSIIVKVN